MDSINKEIVRKVIAGRYKGDLGVVYEFTDGGRLVFKGKSFLFDVIVDRVGYKNDVVVIRSGNKLSVFDFWWNGGRLYLFGKNKVGGEFGRRLVLSPF